MRDTLAMMAYLMGSVTSGCAASVGLALLMIEFGEDVKVLVPHGTPRWVLGVLFFGSSAATFLAGVALFLWLFTKLDRHLLLKRGEGHWVGKDFFLIRPEYKPVDDPKST